MIAINTTTNELNISAVLIQTSERILANTKDIIDCDERIEQCKAVNSGLLEIVQLQTNTMRRLIDRVTALEARLNDEGEEWKRGDGDE